MVGGQPPRLHLLPRDEMEFLDVWQVSGLRGTGSFSFRVENLFVSDGHTMRQPDPKGVI